MQPISNIRLFCRIAPFCIYGYVHVERAQPIDTIFLKIELFAICLHQISDVGEPRPGRE